MGRLWLSIGALVGSGCFIDATGEALPSGEGAAPTTSTNAGAGGSSTTDSMGGFGGAPAGGGGSGSTGGAPLTGGGGAGGQGGQGGAPCTSQGAIFDGVDDQLSIDFADNTMSDSTDFAFSIRVAPNGLPNGNIFVAGRIDEVARSGWAVTLAKTATEVRARGYVYETNANTPCLVVSDPIVSFPVVIRIDYLDTAQLSATIDGAATSVVVCNGGGLANATTVPFRVGSSGVPAALGTLPFKGGIDDIQYISAPTNAAACVNGDTRDRGWDFSSVIGQLVDPIAGCTDQLVLGATINSGSDDPEIGCVP